MKPCAGIIDNPEHREQGYTKMENVSVSGTGSASVLPMTDEECAAVVERPVGFVPPPVREDPAEVERLERLRNQRPPKSRRHS